MRFGLHGFLTAPLSVGAIFRSRCGRGVSGEQSLSSGKMRNFLRRNLLCGGVLVFLLVWLAGCGSTVPHFVPQPGADYSRGMFHRVLPGESLALIAGYYERNMQLLAQFNELSSASSVYPGQILYIPPTNDATILTAGRLSMADIRKARMLLSGEKTGGRQLAAAGSERESALPIADKRASASAKRKVEPQPEPRKYASALKNPVQVSQLRPAESRSARTVSATASPAPVETRSASRSWRSRLFGSSKSEPEAAVVKETVVNGGDGQFHWPLERFRWSRGFSTQWLSPHQGVDLAVEEGTPIHAADDGVVLQSGRLGEYGNLVVLDHGAGYSTLYGHASKLLVHEGQKVRAGDTIALVGSTGRATGSHLHFEIRYNAKAIDPERKLSKPRHDGEYLVAQGR